MNEPLPTWCRSGSTVKTPSTFVFACFRGVKKVSSNRRELAHGGAVAALNRLAQPEAAPFVRPVVVPVVNVTGVYRVRVIEGDSQRAVGVEAVGDALCWSWYRKLAFRSA